VGAKARWPFFWIGFLLSAAVCLSALTRCSLQEAPRRPQPAPHDPRWAVPLERPGLPNLHKVSDDLYRGAQPTGRGFRELEDMGIRTVVNLRSFHSDRDEMAGTGLGYEHIAMKAWHPEDEDVVRFLRIVTDPERTPVFVHCEHGADRSGVMSAAYRMAVQGWTAEEAVEEMVEGGYGFHGVWRGRLGGYLEELDFDEIKRRAGLSAPGEEG